jgi:large conductance mechanosensitive channel
MPDRYMPKRILENMKKEMFTEFVAFIQKYGVIGLAIGVVIGQAVNQLVGSLVTNIITPVISLILNFALQGQQLRDYKFFGIGLGAFFDDFIKFVLVTFIIYISIRYLAVHFLNDEEKEKLNLLTKPSEKETQKE